ncbi:hypothetical protein B0H13DRAFT_2648490 [Mycena leptocephala]|nr:hypothetical protein B0H13DRAFT_2648490 [Mycena leptocephala]
MTLFPASTSPLPRRHLLLADFHLNGVFTLLHAAFLAAILDLQGSLFSLPAVKPIPQRVALVHIPVDVVAVKADDTEARDHRP